MYIYIYIYSYTLLNIFIYSPEALLCNSSYMCTQAKIDPRVCRSPDSLPPIPSWPLPQNSTPVTLRDLGRGVPVSSHLKGNIPGPCIP